MEQTDETFFPISEAISADKSAFISNFQRPSIDRLMSFAFRRIHSIARASKNEAIRIFSNFLFLFNYSLIYRKY